MQLDLAGDLLLDGLSSVVFSVHDASGNMRSPFRIGFRILASVHQWDHRRDYVHRDQISARCHKSGAEYRVHRCGNYSCACDLLLSADTSKCGLASSCCDCRLALRRCGSCNLKSRVASDQSDEAPSSQSQDFDLVGDYFEPPMPAVIRSIDACIRFRSGVASIRPPPPK